ncbi:MAG: response regulator [Candidatus Abyssobacteria bacterium SURF_17]|uniref:Response regulator n=1 Tax=Candidatus Abyssobacteria bacterium SURF_17 TaxID=2093361 RepID=A0A419F091_9BACT|nr:MAG: response regulator [Candidatus Abyssubacteria bacterium SURF_17]
MPVTQPSEKTVLVVDDEKNVRLFLKTVLEKAGFKVETAVDGVEALEKVRAHPPDVISLDLVMPKKSGAKFLLEIRKDKDLQNIPVVLVTAHAKDALGKEDFDAIMSGDSIRKPETYLIKPVKAETYLANIKRALEMKHMKTLVSVGVAESSSKNLKDEIKELLDDADPEKLKEALKLLREKK